MIDYTETRHTSHFKRDQRTKIQDEISGRLWVDTSLTIVVIRPLNKHLSNVGDSDIDFVGPDRTLAPLGSKISE